MQHRAATSVLNSLMVTVQDHITESTEVPPTRLTTSSCSLTPKPLPSQVFPNLWGYDAQMILQAISQTKSDIICTPNIAEKYIHPLISAASRLHQLHAVHLFCIWTSTRDYESQGLKELPHHSTEYMPTPSRQSLLCCKGIYPYEHMDDSSQFTETNLPPKEAFYSQLLGLTYTGHTKGNK